MAFRKAMILVGSLLLVTTSRIQQELDSPPDALQKENEGKMKHPGARTAKKIVEQAGEQDQEELAEALWQKMIALQSALAEDEQSAEAADQLFAGPRNYMWEPKAKGAKGKGKTDKGKDDGKGKGKGKESDEGDEYAGGAIIIEGGERLDRAFRFPILEAKWWITRLAFVRGPFTGFIYEDIPDSKTLLIKCWKALQDFGEEVIIPVWGNYVAARVGDKITFDVAAFTQEGEGTPRPVAQNVIIRQRGNGVGAMLLREGPAQTNVCTQVMYYLSDHNLRKDKFFQDIITATEGDWIGTKFLLLCQRLKKLGASTRSIIDSMQDVPGFEVSDVPGQEAVRRTSPPPPLELGYSYGQVQRRQALLDSKQSAATAMAKLSAGPPVLAKRTYTIAMMKLLGDPANTDALVKELEQPRQKRIK